MARNGRWSTTSSPSPKPKSARLTGSSPISWCSTWPTSPSLPKRRPCWTPGAALWQAYFAHTDVRTVRDEYKLNRPDVGWYQIRNALKARNASGDTAPVNFGPFEPAYQA